MRMSGRLAIAGAVVFVLLQMIRPGIPTKTNGAELQVPPEIRRILEEDCYSCHSEQKRLSWFDQIVPAYWLARHDILTAREHLNFSELGSQPPAVQKATLYEAVNMIQLGAMPLPRFLALHPEAKVTPEELTALKEYLSPWMNVAVLTNPAVPNGVLAPRSLALVSPEPNGFQFDPSWEDWKLISITDRGDNDTFRFIFGNDIAIKAAQTGNISPWPDGTRFAKAAWHQKAGPDGFMHPDNFVQVEFMVKDAHRYEETEGWGWGRWRGLNLTPYGKDAAFVNECTGCHKPVRGNDYVYTLPLTAAKVGQVAIVNNRAAALPKGLPYQPIGWGAITMYADRDSHTMATLYGNDTAMQAVKDLRVGEHMRAKYPAGTLLALITWAQRDDPHWFGARIPDVPLSVEFVQVTAPGQASTYSRFAGATMAEEFPAARTVEGRTGFVLGLPAARLP